MGSGISLSKRGFAKERIKRLAQTRVEILWQQAISNSKSRPEIARLQMRSARKIAQRSRTKIPWNISRRLCKQCGAILIPGKTCKVRMRHNRAKHMVVTCTECGKVKRYYLTNLRSHA
ncbi:ribonuclease P [Candidatus Thorarchaeota archaeon]|nr:MAG: ribonuclease P [Candidatus Thorarchaeota archaeon]